MKFQEFESKAELTGKPVKAVPAAAPPKAEQPKGPRVVKPAAATAKPKPKPKSAAAAVRPKKVERTPSPVEDPEEDEPENAAPDVVPRVDISEKVNEGFLNKLGDKNWKQRKEAMDELKNIISTAKFVNKDVGGLIPVLAARFNDANKIISSQAVEVTKDLTLAMGPNIKCHFSGKEDSGFIDSPQC